VIHKLIIFGMFFSFASPQNIELYLSLIEEGKIDGVKENISELMSKYPNDPGVLYLDALLTNNANKSINLYKQILQNHPDSKYAPDIIMKIGEYFYATGLYTQAAKLLKNIPQRYPRYKHIQRSTYLMIDSYNAIGEADSARYYAMLIKSMFPKIDTDGIEISGIKSPLSQVFNFKAKKNNNLGPFVVQVGAFSTKENANRLKLQISQFGYNVIVSDIESNGKRFYAVRINRYKSKEKADQIGREIKKKIGVDYRVLYRPVK